MSYLMTYVHVRTIHLKLQQVIVGIHNYRLQKIESYHLFKILVYEHIKISQISGCPKWATVAHYVP